MNEHVLDRDGIFVITFLQYNGAHNSHKYLILSI